MTVVNMSLNFKFNKSFDLSMVEMFLPSVKYNPGRFNAAIIRIEKFGCTASLFSSGSVTLCGAKSKKLAKKSRRYLMKKLSAIHDELSCSPIIVRNIVTVFQTVILDIDFTYEKLRSNSLINYIYLEKERYPGIVVKNNKRCAMLFKTGKVIITGFTKKKKSLRFYNSILQIINE